MALTQGHRGAWHVGFPGLLPLRQPLPRTVNPELLRNDERVDGIKGFQGQLTLACYI